MTDREKLIIRELKDKMIADAGYICEICGKSVNYDLFQLAHRITKSKVNINKYGDKIINHPINMKVVCGLACNSKANIGYNPTLEKEIVDEIKAVIHG